MSGIVADLYTLPSLAIYALFMSISGIAASVCCLLAARIARPPDGKDHLDVAMRTTGAVMAALTLILAFCAVQARSQASDARAAITAEVTAIGSLARIADRLGAPGHALKRELVAYLHSIADVEFPQMATHGRHGATQRHVEAVEDAAYMTAGSASEALATDLLQEVDDIESARDRRLHSAQIGLPHEFWLLIGLLFGLLVITGALYPARRHMVAMLGIQAAGCGALIAFVFIVDQPFLGAVRITAEPYAALHQTLEHRSANARRGPVFAAP